MAAIDDIPPSEAGLASDMEVGRHHFGITAFGINAVTKDEGNVLIPEHEHGETAEQELYFIHRGEALATLDDEQVHVPAGSAVMVEGGTHRKFEALASPTTLIVIGGTPGKAYEVGDWEK